MQTDPSSSAAFFKAIQSGDQAGVEILLEHEPTLANATDQAGLSAILIALYNGKPAIAELLIRRGARLNIFEAAAAGQLERVRDLLDRQPDQANAFALDGFQPLGLACFFGRLPVVELLLAHGAEVNSPSQNPMGVTPLHSAVAAQKVSIARLLLIRRADPNARQAGGFTPLHAAAQNGQVEMARLLLDHGANPLARAEDGRSPRDFALEAGADEILKIL